MEHECDTIVIPNSQSGDDSSRANDESFLISRLLLPIYYTDSMLQLFLLFNFVLLRFF